MKGTRPSRTSESDSKSVTIKRVLFINISFEQIKESRLVAADTELAKPAVFGEQ